MIRVFIVDDHPIVREGLEQILRESPDIAVAGEAGNSQEALSLTREHDFDVMLLDISLPGRSGLDILDQIKSLKPEMNVLILSAYPEEQYAVRALRSSADGYLTKASASDELITAIRKVSHGGKYISAALGEKLAFDLAGDMARPLHASLSDREYRVLCMIASGNTVKEIGETLNLSIKTISTYRRRILEKMQMKNNAQITHYAIQQGLVN